MASLSDCASAAKAAPRGTPLMFAWNAAPAASPPFARAPLRRAWLRRPPRIFCVRARFAMSCLRSSVASCSAGDMNWSSRACGMSESMFSSMATGGPAAGLCVSWKSDLSGDCTASSATAASSRWKSAVAPVACSAVAASWASTCSTREVRSLRGLAYMEERAGLLSLLSSPSSASRSLKRASAHCRRCRSSCTSATALALMPSCSSRLRSICSMARLWRTAISIAETS
mmetsp:Transcript_25398/g.79577  ORF Transcript_25398/g.79577 Transcript_25398/m.79577 type:complete len:229 (-) Transcript_25398:1526-2212(-)